jgi:hypothetical protein
MAIKTQRDEILFLILTGVAAKLLVMDFEICRGTAQLAWPAIASQYLLAKFPVAFRFEPDRRLLERAWRDVDD